MARITRRRPTAFSETPKGGPALNREDIARRAYELFLERGGTHGYDVEDWIAAEHELTSGAAPVAASRVEGAGRPSPVVGRIESRRSHSART